MAQAVAQKSEDGDAVTDPLPEGRGFSLAQLRAENCPRGYCRECAGTNVHRSNMVCMALVAAGNAGSYVGMRFDFRRLMWAGTTRRLLATCSPEHIFPLNGKMWSTW